MINEKKLIERNIEMSTEFSRYLFEHPELKNEIPEDSEIVLLTKFDKELMNFNLKVGKEIESEGEKVVYIDIENIQPKRLSRLTDVKLHAIS